MKNDNQTLAKVSSIQMNSQQDVEQNLLIAESAIAEAKQHSSQLVVLPENVCSMGKQQQTAQRFDELSARFSMLAEKYQLYLLAGTLPCPYSPEGRKIKKDKLRQSSLLFAPDGSQIARYDKIHLFRALVNDAHGNYDEGMTFEAGEKLVTAPIELNNQVVNLGMMICFDLRFPKMAQGLRQMGANILAAPSAFTYQTGKANWSLLLQARALDSQCLLIGAAQGGEHQYTDGSVRQTWGHAGIAGCDGQMIAQFDDWLLEDKAVHRHKDNYQSSYQLVMAEFDSEFQMQQRNRLPIFNCHRLV